MTTSEKLKAGQLVKEQLVDLLHAEQELNTALLLPRMYVAELIAVKMDVTAATVRKYLTQHVTTGEILEIKPHRDWQVDLPGGDDLPVLYAVPYILRSAYVLDAERPKSKGAGQTSFVITPGDLEIFLTRKRGQLGLPPRVPGIPAQYSPTGDEVVSRSVYEKAVVAVMRSAGHTLGPSGAVAAVDAVLEELGLVAPKF